MFKFKNDIEQQLDSVQTILLAFAVSSEALEINSCLYAYQLARQIRWFYIFFEHVMKDFR